MKFISIVQYLNSHQFRARQIHVTANASCMHVNILALPYLIVQVGLREGYMCYIFCKVLCGHVTYEPSRMFHKFICGHVTFELTWISITFHVIMRFVNFF